MSTVLRRIQWKAVTMGHIATMALGLSMDSTSVRDATVIEKIVRDEMDLTWFSAYAEYAGVGLQMYTYHMDYIGWIMRDLFRTVSLMVDIRLHIHGASIEECVQFMSQHVPWFCVDEVRGFVGMWSVCPGLAVAPKLGEWKMRELTREALRRYPCHVGELHGEVFLEREMPIGVVEKRVEEWEEDEEDEDDEEDEEDVDEEEDLENEEEPILVKD
ncbi:hypothetical protein BC829DRAFT_398175 [Chytridium lagenaria]|nr:hypothetical protein BC829DRAFT_398175 [Chytridium lagenaria]